MKGMTNNQIIMSEAAKLDPATLHAIATAHHTPEQIAAMAANAVTTDENGDEQPATIADVEIILAAAELHTFDHWKKEGKSVKKGETHLIECYLWKYTTRPSKAQREAAEAEGKEAAPAPHFYPTKSHLFSCLQVHDAKQAPAGAVPAADGSAYYFPEDRVTDALTKRGFNRCLNGYTPTKSKS